MIVAQADAGKRFMFQEFVNLFLSSVTFPASSIPSSKILKACSSQCLGKLVILRVLEPKFCKVKRGKSLMICNELPNQAASDSFPWHSELQAFGLDGAGIAGIGLSE